MNKFIFIVAYVTETTERSTHVLGEILTLKCSAHSLYPMTVTWEESRLLYSIKNKTDSRETEGLYNILNSTISVKISLMTPLSFNLYCEFITYFYFQPDNFTKVHGLYQIGLLFEKPVPYNVSFSYYNDEDVITIQRKST